MSVRKMTINIKLRTHCKVLLKVLLFLYSWNLMSASSAYKLSNYLIENGGLKYKTGNEKWKVIRKR